MALRYTAEYRRFFQSMAHLRSMAEAIRGFEGRADVLEMLRRMDHELWAFCEAITEDEEE